MKVWILRYDDWEYQNIIGITSKKEEIEKFKKDYPDLSDYIFDDITIDEYDLEENSLFSQDSVKNIIKEYEEAKEEELRRRKQEEEDG